MMAILIVVAWVCLWVVGYIAMRELNGDRKTTGFEKVMDVILMGVPPFAMVVSVFYLIKTIIKKLHGRIAG